MGLVMAGGVFSGTVEATLDGQKFSYLPNPPYYNAADLHRQMEEGCLANVDDETVIAVNYCCMPRVSGKVNSYTKGGHGRWLCKIGSKTTA